MSFVKEVQTLGKTVTREVWIGVKNPEFFRTSLMNYTFSLHSLHNFLFSFSHIFINTEIIFFDKTIFDTNWYFWDLKRKYIVSKAINFFFSFSIKTKQIILRVKENFFVLHYLNFFLPNLWKVNWKLSLMTNRESLQQNILNLQFLILVLAFKLE